VSNYPGYNGIETDVPPGMEEVEVRCNACKGSGQDRDEADCIPCEGWGTIISVVPKRK
jgi:DnaJ-class molecular chaperone